MARFFSFLGHFFSKQARRNSLHDLSGLAKSDAVFGNLVTESKVPGMSVTVFKKGEKILEKGYGHSSLEKENSINTEDTIFRIASISKCITGLALGKMVEEGLMDWDTSFYEYVPDYPKKKYDFTIRQLASHTAGIRGYQGKEFALNQAYGIKDSIHIFKDDPLVFEPGKGYLYNSYDFVLLSLAMQEAGKMPFENYVEKKVLVPIGMLKTTIPEKKDPKLGLESLRSTAEFYTKTSTGFKNAVKVNNFYKLAGGGYLSTSNEIAKLGQAILEGELLKKETYDQLFTPQQIKGVSTYYGLGFQVSQDAKGRRFVGHVGNSVGAYSNLFVYPEEQVVVSILTNCTAPNIQDDLDNAINSLFDSTPLS
ncbi:MAG: serine hydrolase domain-containing protein [Bacteroidota bacterium]